MAIKFNIGIFLQRSYRVFFFNLIDASSCYFNTTFEHDLEARASTMQK